jgi:hypothetical protein
VLASGQLWTAAGARRHDLSLDSHEGTRCEEKRVTVDNNWASVDIDVATSCASLPELNALTISNESDTMDLLVDEIRYE